MIWTLLLGCTQAPIMRAKSKAAPHVGQAMEKQQGDMRQGQGYWGDLACYTPVQDVFLVVMHGLDWVEFASGVQIRVVFSSCLSNMSSLWSWT
ncbi:hypothetical protein ACOMHN_009384 [Nucella lapillus]